MTIEALSSNDQTGGLSGTGGLTASFVADFSGFLDQALEVDARDSTQLSGDARTADQTQTGADAAGETDEEAQTAAAARQAALEYLQKWIVSGGAPEELEHDRVDTNEPIDKDGDGIPDFLQRSLPENALETVSQTIADPENEGEIHVAVTKIDAEGKPKVTRVMRFDNGDGENRGELTPERAAAKNDGRDAPGRPGSSKEGQAAKGAEGEKGAEDENAV